MNLQKTTRNIVVLILAAINKKLKTVEMRCSKIVFEACAGSIH